MSLEGIHAPEQFLQALPDVILWISESNLVVENSGTVTKTSGKALRLLMILRAAWSFCRHLQGERWYLEELWKTQEIVQEIALYWEPELRAYHASGMTIQDIYDLLRQVPLRCCTAFLLPCICCYNILLALHSTKLIRLVELHASDKMRSLWNFSL